MFSQYLKQIENVASYPVASLLIFIPFFIAVVWMVLAMKKEHADRMSRLPLDDQERGAR